MRCSVSALLGRWHGRRCRKIQQWRPEGVQEEHSQARELVEEVEEQGPLCLCPLHRLVLCLDPCLAPSVSSHCWSVSVASAFESERTGGLDSTAAEDPNGCCNSPNWVLDVGFFPSCAHSFCLWPAPKESGKQDNRSVTLALRS